MTDSSKSSCLLSSCHLAFRFSFHSRASVFNRAAFFIYLSKINPFGRPLSASCFHPLLIAPAAQNRRSGGHLLSGLSAAAINEPASPPPPPLSACFTRRQRRRAREFSAGGAGKMSARESATGSHGHLYNTVESTRSSHRSPHDDDPEGRSGKSGGVAKKFFRVHRPCIDVSRNACVARGYAHKGAYTYTHRTSRRKLSSVSLDYWIWVTRLHESSTTCREYSPRPSNR